MPILDDLHQMVSCPHGNETCPCPDGLACHYEGLDAWVCPTRSAKDDRGMHCHLEGCRWAGTEADEGCGLAKLLGNPFAMHLPVPGTPEWLCGSLRFVEAIWPDVGGDHEAP